VSWTPPGHGDTPRAGGYDCRVVTVRTLTLDELNRATLARQRLLPREQPPYSDERSGSERPRDADVVSAVERVAGLQSQDSRAAAIGLWTRVPGLRREQIADLLRRRLLVKGTLMRATLHLVSAADYLLLRPAVQPALSRWAGAVLRRRAPGLDMHALAEEARPFLDEPHSAAELRRYLSGRHPEADAEAMAIAVRVHLPLVQAPTEKATWGVPGNPAFVNAAAWLGRPIPSAAGAEALIRRYLAAFGPAHVADVQTWSGLSGLRDAVERLRPELRRFCDARGRELVDLPRAVIPPAGDPVSPLFLPAWDSTLLAYEDRSRLVPEKLRGPVYLEGRSIGPVVLVDGFTAATWRLEQERDSTTVVIRPLVAVSGEAREALARSGERLARFASSRAGTVGVSFTS